MIYEMKWLYLPGGAALETIILMGLMTEGR